MTSHTGLHKQTQYIFQYSKMQLMSWRNAEYYSLNVAGKINERTLAYHFKSCCRTKSVD